MLQLVQSGELVRQLLYFGLRRPKFSKHIARNMYIAGGPKPLMAGRFSSGYEVLSGKHLPQLLGNCRSRVDQRHIRPDNVLNQRPEEGIVRAAKHDRIRAPSEQWLGVLLN